MRSDVPGVYGPDLTVMKNGILGGKSLLSRVQKHYKEVNGTRVLCFHCINHNLNLGMGDALKKLVPRLMKCIRTISSWTRRSSKRVAKLRQLYTAQVAAMDVLVNEMASAHDDHGGGRNRLLSLKRFCPTRWLGLLQCTIAIITAWPALVAIREKLVADGYTPAADSNKKRKHRLGDGDDSDGSDDSDVGALVNDDDDTGMGDGEDDKLSPNDVQPGPNKRKRSALLHRRVGITTANHGRLCFLNDIFKVYEVAIKVGQFYSKPVSHVIGGTVVRFIQLLVTSFIVSPNPGGAVYRQWKLDVTAQHLHRNTAAEAAALIVQLDTELVAYATTLRDSVQARVQPYQPYYDAFEWISPWCSQRVASAAATLATVSELCQVWNLPLAGVQSELEVIKADLVTSATAADVTQAKDNLLEYFNKNIVARGDFWADKMNAMNFIARVFGTPVSSAFVEHLFSGMAHGTGGRRSTTAMATHTRALHCRSTRPISADAADATGGAGHFVV